MEEPVHHDEQHDDCQQARRGLNCKRRGVDCVDNRDNDEPGHHSRCDRRTRADRHGPPIDGVGPEEAGGDDREHENRLQSLTEDEDTAVDDNHAGAEGAAIRVTRIGRRAMLRDALPDQHRQYYQPGQSQCDGCELPIPHDPDPFLSNRSNRRTTPNEPRIFRHCRVIHCRLQSGGGSATRKEPGDDQCRSHQDNLGNAVCPRRAMHKRRGCGARYGRRADRQVKPCGSLILTRLAHRDPCLPAADHRRIQARHAVVAIPLRRRDHFRLRHTEIRRRESKRHVRRSVYRERDIVVQDARLESRWPQDNGHLTRRRRLCQVRRPHLCRLAAGRTGEEGNDHQDRDADNRLDDDHPAEVPEEDYAQ